jgi:undecaprenyl-phosphate galactose phosphotransferase
LEAQSSVRLEEKLLSVQVLEQDPVVDKVGMDNDRKVDESPASPSPTNKLQDVVRYLPIVTLDFISLTLVLVSTYTFLGVELDLGLYQSGYPNNIVFYGLVMVTVIGLFQQFDLYQHRVINTRVEQSFFIIKSFLVADLVMVVIAFFFFSNAVSENFKEFIVWFTILGVPITLIGRSIFRWLIQTNNWLSTAKPSKNIIIIGAGQAGKLYAANLKHKVGNVNVHFFDDDPKKIGKKVYNFSILGKPEDIIYSLVGKQAEEICIVIKNISKKRLLQIIQVAKKTSLPVKVLSSHYNMMFTGMYDETNSLVQPIPIKNTYNQKYDLIFKRLMDILFSALGIVLLFIPGLIIALLVKTNSRGPVLHSSFRVGKDGKLFQMYKFRSMVIDQENIHENAAVERLKSGKHMGKVANDPRITSIGAILRKYSLDEIPQLLNVLKGDMSMVGPRPCFQYEMELFDEWHHQRFVMKPGITGLWQITGRQMGELHLNDAMTTDVYYTNNYFLWMDFRILFRTIPVVIGGNGS